jgi:hypothetical protein
LKLKSRFLSYFEETEAGFLIEKREGESDEHLKTRKAKSITNEILNRLKKFAEGYSPP